MPKRVLKFGFKAILLKLKFLGILGFLALFLFIFFAIRVTYAPLDISFAKDFITTALHDKATGNYALMDKVRLYWPDLRKPLYIEFDGAQLLNKDGISIISVEQAAVSFSRRGLLTARIMPKSIILKGPTLRFVRSAEKGFQFDVGLVDSEEKIEEQFALTTRIFNHIARPGQQNQSNSLLSYLEVFAIEDARVLVDDRIVQQTWSFPDFDLALFSTQSGLKGSVDMVLTGETFQDSGVHLDMGYDWGQKNVVLSADLKAVNLGTLAEKVPELGVLAQQKIVLDARVETILDETFHPLDIRVNASSEKGEIIHPQLSDNPVGYNDLSLNATYNYPGKTLNLKDTAITLGGVAVHAEGTVTQEDQKISGPVKIMIDQAEHEQVATLWPKFLDGDDSKKWIVHKMSGGLFKDVILSFDLHGIKPAHWDFSVKNVIAEFSVENMNLDYKPPLDAAHNLYGSGRFDLNTDILTITVDQGKIGTMEVSDSTLIFDEVVAVGKGGADLLINLKGNIPEILRYIAKDPINAKDKTGLDADQVKGDAALKVGLKFPTKKDVKKEEFDIDVSGTLSDILFPDVIDTLDLSGGTLDFVIHKGEVSLKGKSMLESREIDLAWNGFLDSSDKPYKEKISAKIMADPNLRTLLGIDVSDYIEGSVFADIAYAAYHDGSAKADIILDLTPGVFLVRPFGFEKPSGEKASAQLSAYFKDKKITKIEHLNGQGKKFDFSGARLAFRMKGDKAELMEGSFPDMVLEETIGRLDFVFDERGALHLDLKADILDARPFLKTRKKSENAYDSPPITVSVQAKEMITAPEQTLKQAQLNADIDAQGDFSRWAFDAQAGTGRLQARYQPGSKGERTFTLTAEDAGAVLKAFDIYDTMIGGTMNIKGIPARGIYDRNLKGRALISDFRVVEAPALTKILSILSLTGIDEALSDKGLQFEKLAADFEWLYRSEGSLLKIKDGRTSGNSLGLLFEGVYDSALRTVDISGTIVPMSGLNKVIGEIPLVGDILTGGSGGVFAATFKITGQSDNPKISANPLSVLTPGILRKILWE